MSVSLCTSCLRSSSRISRNVVCSSSTTMRRNLSLSSFRFQAPKPATTLPFAQIIADTLPPTNIKDQLRRFPQHPLLQFFNSLPESATLPEAQRKSDDSDSTPELRIPSSFSRYDTSKIVSASSRSWLAPELRLKSSHELHVLWYVLLMERNRLATSWDEVARVGARNLAKRSGENLSSRNHRVRKSMARIKFVLNERRLALIDAQKAVRSTEGSSAAASAEESLWEDITEEMDGGGSNRQ